MSHRRRIYETALADHLASHRQMAFLSGPRQVGKTTSCGKLSDVSLNWDDVDQRDILLAGPRAVADRLHLDRLAEKTPVVLFDELHKFPRWKTFLKGFFDTYGKEVRILVTGSSRMDAFRRGGDSLMGRYFPFRMHPFSAAETLTQDLPDPAQILRAPKKPRSGEWEALWKHGGFPEPFLKRDPRFSRRWQSLRTDQLVRGDIRDLTQVQQLDQMESLVRLLADRSATQLVYQNLAREVRVSVDTVRRWIEVLRSLHLGFLVRPWFRRVTRSLRKEPRWFLRDWAGVAHPGRRSETFVGCHLLKAVEGWTDLGYGMFELGYLRDKEKREVDFVVVRDGEPWFLVEAKTSDAPLNRSLEYFQESLGAPFAFQIAVKDAYVDADCFASPRGPLKVPAKTFLSQLL
ncbi:MAG: ATP-binding protein [Planctomycetota bacterium]